MMSIRERRRRRGRGGGHPLGIYLQLAYLQQWRLGQRFGLHCNEVYQDSVDDFYVAECDDGGVYLVTSDLCYARLLAEGMEGAAAVMDRDTLDNAVGPWRYYGQPYDRFSEEERSGEEEGEEVGGDFTYIC